jgi:hypothetical protein
MMTNCYMQEVECPKCGKRNKITLWNTVNARLNPEIRGDLLNGRIHQYSCKACGNTGRLDKALLYHDTENHFMVWYLPFDNIQDVNFLDQFKDDGRLDMNAGIPSSENMDHAENIHYVFSMSELALYIHFRERLAQRKESIQRGKVVCFSCGNTINDNEYYFCVQRLLQKRGQGRNSHKDEILDATASIQMCAECLAQAATKEVDLKEQTLPLLQLEVTQFLKFTRNYVAGKRITNTEASSCTLCKGDVKTGDKYIRIEVTEETSNDYVVKVKRAHTLGVLCRDCAEKYLWGSVEGL